VSSAAHEFKTNFTLLRSHCTIDAAEDGPRACLRIPRSKSDRYNDGNNMFYLSIPGDVCCPVNALACYVHDRRPAADGPLFVKASGAYVTRIDITNALKRAAVAASLPPSRISTHSLRMGGAFAMMDANVPWHTIKLRGRWKDETMPLLYAKLSTARLAVATAALSSTSMSDSSPLFTATL
jgi:hypothetical protein